MESTPWTKGALSELTADVDGARLLVTRVDERGEARFLVFKPLWSGSQPVLVQSGHCENMQQAMEKAEKVAQRLAAGTSSAR